MEIYYFYLLGSAWFWAHSEYVTSAWQLCVTINTIKENSNTVAGVAKWLCKIEIVQYRQLFTVVCSHCFGVCEFFISLPEESSFSNSWQVSCLQES